MWIFGYGSLVWRPEFPFEERRPAFIEGWVRRFWQGSTDHRGVPGAPGRVVTLVPEAGSVCWGTAYRVAGANRDLVMERLDWRERGGYERCRVAMHRVEGGDVDPVATEAWTYRATPENPNYLGPAPLVEIAQQVARASGPSGANVEYVLRLAESLREMDASDPHVFELETKLRDSL